MAPADQDHGPTGGPGYSGTAPAAEAAVRRASVGGANPEEVGGEGQRPPAAMPLAGEERELGAVSGSAQPSGAGAVLGTDAASEMGAGAELAVASALGAAPETDSDLEAASRPDGDPECGNDGNHQASLEHHLEELTARADKADEYLELAQRTKADFENYRKRAAREAAAAQERGMVKLARELLPAVDNLDRALAAARTAVAAQDGQLVDDGSATLVSGIKLVHADVIAALARVGIEPFSPEGEPFDPQYHEAIAQQPFEGAEPGTVVEVYQRGFRLGDSVLRPARVVVAG
jgi:molecular chaperone GrpE